MKKVYGKDARKLSGHLPAPGLLHCANVAVPGALLLLALRVVMGNGGAYGLWSARLRDLGE